MDNSSSPNNSTELFHDWLLRREAGEDWRTEGMHEQLLGEIVTREVMLEKLLEKKESTGYGDEEADRLWDNYMNQAERVKQLKEQEGISDPPPLDSKVHKKRKK